MGITNIQVSDTERRRNGSDSYVAFNIETKVEGQNEVIPSGQHDVWRRFSEFLALRNYLQKHYPAVVLPCLPPKNPLTQKTEEHVEKRKTGLQLFLRRVASHPSLCQDEYFCRFLHADDWVVVKITGTSWGLLTLKPKEPDINILAKESHAKELKKAITAVLTCAETIKRKQNDISDVYDKNARAVEKWSTLESDMSNMLVQMSQFYTKENSALKNKIKTEDEVFYEIMHEYEQLMDSVVDVCTGYKRKLLEKEKQEEVLASKQKELADLEATNGQASGFSSYFKKQTPEQYQQKLSFAKFCVQEETEKTEALNKEMEDYSKLVKCELEFFDENKTSELKQIFKNFVSAQIEFFEKDLERWTQVKEKTLA